MEEAKIRNIIRILNTDIEGTVPVGKALRKVHGVGFSMANAVCNVLNHDKKKKVGLLSQEDIQKIEGLLKNPKGKIPDWLLNRRKDLDTGEDLHLTSTDLKLRKEFDIKKLQKIKCYRGVRHSQKLPVRGQRTRGHFRKSGKAIGVAKKGKKGGKKQ